MQHGESSTIAGRRFERWILETPRLMLREIADEDARELLRLHSHPLVTRYLCEPPWDSLERAHEARLADARQRARGGGRWACIDKRDGLFVGVVSLTCADEPSAEASAEVRTAELAYRFFPEQWGRGLATETGRAVLAHAFAELDLAVVVARVLADNAASIRVLEKLGMRNLGARRDAQARWVVRYAAGRGDPAAGARR